MEEENYPGILSRIMAIMTDSVIIIILMFLVSYFFSYFNNVPTILRIFAFVFFFLLYDPLFTSTFGGTIGHMMIGIRVKRESDEKKNILFPLAIIRFIVKAGLGWISLLTVTGNAKRKAIHDYLIGSVVVYGKQVVNHKKEF